MRVWVKGLAFAAVLCLAAVCRAEEGRGRLAFVGTNAVALGEYPNDEDRTGRVTVRNAGDGPLSVTRVLTTCSCLRVDGFPRSLRPGETGEVAVTVTKYGVAGAFEKVCYIQSDDPRTPLAALRLAGVARPLFTVACDATNLLGAVTPGLVWTGRYTVAATEAGLSLGTPALRSRGTRCDYTVRTNGGERAVYEVTTAVTFEGQGALASALVFPVLGKAGVADVPVRLEVTATVRPPLRVTPDRLSLPASGFPLTRRLLVAADASGPDAEGRIQCSTDSGAVAVSVRQASGGRAFLVELAFPADYPVRHRTAGQDAIRITCGRDSVAVAVAVMAEAEPPPRGRP